MIERLLFGGVSAVLLFSGLMAVGARNLVHAVFWLAITLATTALLYILLQAPFLATIQLILYTGGVLTLMLFGVMLTRRATELQGVFISNEANGHRRALPVVAVAAGLVVAAVTKTPALKDAKPALPVETAEIGKRILGEHLLAFEVLSVLLLAALIGAIVVARRKDAALEESEDPRERVKALPGTRLPGAEGSAPAGRNRGLET